MLFISRKMSRNVNAFRPRYRPLKTSFRSPRNHARGVPVPTEPRSAIYTIIINSRSGLNGAAIKIGSTDDWSTTADITAHASSREPRLLIAAPQYDQNFLQMCDIHRRANAYGLKDAIFPPFDHGYFSDGESLQE